MASQSSDAPPGRAGETRARLLRAGEAAFSRKGLAAVNLKRDILEPAQVSVGSFYHQFKDKTELLLAILADHAELQRQRFSEVHRPDGARSPEEIARSSYSLMFDLADQHPDAIRIQVRQRADEDPRIRSFIEEDRLRWRRSLAADYARLADAYGWDLEVELAAELITMLTSGAMEHYLALPAAERPKTRRWLLDGLVKLTRFGLPGLTSAPTSSAPPKEPS